MVELSTAKGAEIKYSTVQNWFAGDEHGKGGIYNFVTKRGLCHGADSKISWTQVCPKVQSVQDGKGFRGITFSVVLTKVLVV